MYYYYTNWKKNLVAAENNKEMRWRRKKRARYNEIYNNNIFMVVVVVVEYDNIIFNWIKVGWHSENKREATHRKKNKTIFQLCTHACIKVAYIESRFSFSFFLGLYIKCIKRNIKNTTKLIHLENVFFFFFFFFHLENFRIKIIWFYVWTKFRVFSVRKGMFSCQVPVVSLFSYFMEDQRMHFMFHIGLILGLKQTGDIRFSSGHRKLLFCKFWCWDS